MLIIKNPHVAGNGRGLFKTGIGVLVLAGFLIPCSTLVAQSDCATAKVEHAGAVSLDTKVTWKPATCRLVLQAYQQGRLVGEYGKQAGVASGTVSISQLTEGKTGQTELKGWVPGSSAPAFAVWLTVPGKK